MFISKSAILTYLRHDSEELNAILDNFETKFTD